MNSPVANSSIKERSGYWKERTIEERQTKYEAHSNPIDRFIEEFRQLILKDKDLEIHCTHNLGRFSIAIRILIIEYVNKNSKNEKLKQYAKELLELPKIEGYDNRMRKAGEL